MLFSWPVVGHQKTVKFLQESIGSQRSVDVYLFQGPPNIGKTLTARLFLKSLVCQGESRPCENCFTCKSINRGTCPDFIEITRPDDKKQIGIEQVRELISKLSRKPIFMKYQLALINQADTLTAEACNALLKTLEEPRGTPKIVLVANSDAVLPTVKSRCQVLKFFPVASSEILSFLKSHPGQKISHNAIEDLARLAGGKIGWAWDMVSNPVKLESFRAVLSDELKLLKAGMSARFKSAEKAAEDNQALREKISLWQLIIRQAALNKAGVSVPLDIMGDAVERLAKYDWRELLGLFDILYSMPQQLAHNVNPKILLENFYLNL